MINLLHLKVDRLEISDKTINVYCHLDIQEQICASCLTSTREFKSYHTHTVRDLDISGREVYLHIRVKQFYCRSCKSYFTQKIPFADSNKSYTHRQSKWIFELSRKQPLSEVGALVNMHAKTVERIFFDCALPQLSDPYKRYEGVTRLGIDELSWRKTFPKEDLYKNIKWLLFRPMHTLTPIEKENLDKTFKLTPILEELYMLKNTFCNIFDMEISIKEALTQIDEWVEYAQTVSNQFLDTFLAFFKRQQTAITNHFKHKVSNAATEGNNNILRTVKRFTFNMTNFEHFRARCFAFKN